VLLYEESGIAIRTIRDYLTGDIDEILIDEPKTFEQVYQFVKKVMPQALDFVRYYDEPQPLFSKFLLDDQVDQTNSPEVTLPSGGSVVITPTEAVVTIDVNSGRSTGQADVEETAFATNKEAAQTIAKQLRLRDLGGLIVIDFIDMWDKRHKQVVERTLKESVRSDKAKVEMGRISKFGLLEMSRQRLKASLVSQSHSICPHCSGKGRVKTPDSAALEALRKIQSAVFAGGVRAVRVRMAPSAALFLLNNKRRTLTHLEEQTSTTILVYADGRMKPEEYSLELEGGPRDRTVLTSPGVSPTPKQEEGGNRQRRESRDNRDGGGRRRGRRRSNRNRGGRRGASESQPENRDSGGNSRGRGRRSRRGGNRGGGRDRSADGSEQSEARSSDSNNGRSDAPRRDDSAPEARPAPRVAARPAPE
ncbi:MAG: ribonuclease E/G, partial [Bdellovibrionales bacterium]|nr:ribonuclease E/G [Bdellovibrionales bacterium]